MHSWCSKKYSVTSVMAGMRLNKYTTAYQSVLGARPSLPTLRVTFEKVCLAAHCPHTYFSLRLRLSDISREHLIPLLSKLNVALLRYASGLYTYGPALGDCNPRQVWKNIIFELLSYFWAAAEKLNCINSKNSKKCLSAIYRNG